MRNTQHEPPIGSLLESYLRRLPLPRMPRRSTPLQTSSRRLPPTAVKDALKKSATQGAATLERGLSILDVFTESDTALTLADLARKTGIYKSTLLRLLASLQKFDYVEHDEGGSYRIGHKGLVLARSFQHSIQPTEIINTVLRGLVSATSESAAFHVRRGDVRICLHRVNSPHRVQVIDSVGDTWPLTTGSAGKVLYAFSPDARVSPELVQIRERLYAISLGESDVHAAGVAAPVFNSAGRCEGAVSLTGPITRFTSEPIARLLIVLLKAAAELTLRFGGNATYLEQARQTLVAEQSPEPASKETIVPRTRRTRVASRPRGSTSTAS